MGAAKLSNAAACFVMRLPCDMQRRTLRLRVWWLLLLHTLEFCPSMQVGHPAGPFPGDPPWLLSSTLRIAAHAAEVDPDDTAG